MELVKFFMDKVQTTGPKANTEEPITRIKTPSLIDAESRPEPKKQKLDTTTTTAISPPEASNEYALEILTQLEKAKEERKVVVAELEEQRERFSESQLDTTQHIVGYQKEIHELKQELKKKEEAKIAWLKKITVGTEDYASLTRFNEELKGMEA